MTWSLLHERMAFMSDLINRAADDPFGGEDGLLLSLQQRWVTMLTAKLDQAAYDDIPAERARAELAARHPGLRGLLDAGALRSLRLRARQRDEQHMTEVFGWLPSDGAARAPQRQTVA